MSRQCTIACYAQPECTTCHRPKAPRGRSVAPEQGPSLCGSDCPGYYEAPIAGHLWPGEEPWTTEAGR